MLLNVPVLLLILILSLVYCDGMIPLQVKSIFYALSLSIKSVLLFVLPVLIFMLLFKTIAKLSRGATGILLCILGALCCSSFCSVLISYPIGKALYHTNHALSLPEATVALEPFWTFSLPKIVSNDVALFSALILGLIFAFSAPKAACRISEIFERIVSIIFRGFSWMIPLFLAGFLVKLIHEKTFGIIVKNYSMVFLVIAVSLACYLFLIYLIANRFSVSKAFQQIKNMTPAIFTGFSTMSSAAALPLTLQGAEKNLPDRPELPRLAIPLTVNIHLIGDGFAIPLFAFAVMSSFGVADPSLLHYLIFACYFVIAKFSVASIPGGGIMVMLPVLENTLGFTGEMSSLISALYILFDPVISSANICGNGGFVLLLNRMIRPFRPVVDTA